MVRAVLNEQHALYPVQYFLIRSKNYSGIFHLPTCLELVISCYLLDPEAKDFQFSCLFNISPQEWDLSCLCSSWPQGKLLELFSQKTLAATHVFKCIQCWFETFQITWEQSNGLHTWNHKLAYFFFFKERTLLAKIYKLLWFKFFIKVTFTYFI